MDIENIVSKDVWAVIKDNYEKGSYTIAVTNLIQYANEIVREKSGLSLDNTKLMDAAFLGQNPKLKINKFQTETEKDIQAGVGYLLKGLCLAVRNPRAHERYNDKKETVDKIILFIDYVLEFVRNSKQPALVEDWLEFVFDENFNNTKKYAEIVLQEIPEKKRYELLVNIFRYRERAKQNLLNNMVNELMNTIKPEELIEFLDNLNKELLYCSDNNSLRMFLSLFPPEKWECLIPLTKLKIEYMVQKSLEQGMMFCLYDDGEEQYIINSEGALSVWAINFMKYFDTKEKVYKILENKLSNKDVDVRNFTIKYFGEIIYDYELINNGFFKSGIKRSLEYFDKETYDNIDFYCNTVEDKELEVIFGIELEIAKDHFAVNMD
ncbi:TIGR02391 family protein [Desulfosporosinus nitroreducens]|uniref:TIGR02391 family protein n=1 Tax=Desulfosporosinus nitroreducens TaxID=2018668 RepID=A0ABT8QYN3_9FIRM|nr:TIGR02391 family protein [Desulfosporosinus nitroreducens]MDO0826007.1 TIGR02391 family protein [Desulfosporosinus nitroreducens]